MAKFGLFAVSLSALALAWACGGSDNTSFVATGGGPGQGGVGGNINFDASGGAVGGASGAGGSTNPDDLRDAACAGWSSEPELLPAVLMLVVDVSGSMNSDAPGSNQSKWEITRDALIEAMDALPPSTAVGIIFYPNLGNSTGQSTTPRPITACVAVDRMIPVDLLGPQGSAHRNAITQGIRNARTGGGTPTHDAYKYAVQNGMMPANFPGGRYMLLITDGQPTFLLECLGTGQTQNPVDEQPIVAEVTAAHAQGIKTFIIGSPGSEQNVSTGADARPWLSQAARAGETMSSANCVDTGPNFCHMDMTQAPNFSQALRDGLAQIAGTVASCDYALPSAPNGQALDLNKINVINTPSGGPAAILPRTSDPNCTDGWRLDPATNHVILCKNTCEAVKSDTNSSLEVLYGCRSEGGPLS